ncbi:MAG: 1-acyl-sn-glycerol-3-phosphate acyltransferase [Prevotella sp.]|jgi:1-acyl-sn-glycerol-3-phosphate acyltransferase|nr:1-acyl-sn-glycerol-3-phosphate acyltransferase [Prevotella sp.]
MESKFDDIAPLYDYEVSATIEELLSDPGFIHAIRYVLPNMNQDDFAREMRSYKTKREFQAKMISPFIWGIVHKTSTSTTLTGWENFDHDKQYMFISNHRDIVLDAGILNISFNDAGVNTTEIAIGDNLLVFPWIKKLVRLNKSFIVQRGVSVRQMLEVSKHLSEYIHYAIQQKKESIWLAQREGRAKDSADRTQESLLKMLTLFPEKIDFIDNLKSLNIIPLSISYEYDPCDYLKAQEFQLKRDNPEYKKTQRDDLLNMETGLLGFKGNIHFRFGKPINDKLEALKTLDRKLQITAAAQCIDREIHANYEIFPGNYVAYDLLTGEDRFADKYSAQEKTAFEDYLNKQIAKINVPDKDEVFLRERMLLMYSNTLKNYLLTTGER